MPQYVIEREIPGIGKMTEAQRQQVTRDSMKVLGDLGPDIVWIESFVTDDKVYCVYFAPDESLIRKHAEMLGLPADRISAVRSLLEPALAQA